MWNRSRKSWKTSRTGNGRLQNLQQSVPGYLVKRGKDPPFCPDFDTAKKERAKDGGTPVILDDALGYTDHERLKLMGAVLAVAAKECQIVIFTCVPERYAFIGEAAVVAM
jgi:hypothetical protein